MDYLEKAFGSDSPNVKSFRFAGHSSPLIMGADEAYLENRRFENLSSQLTSLIGLMEILETERELSGSAGEPLETSISSNKVFLVMEEMRKRYIQLLAS